MSAPATHAVFLSYAREDSVAAQRLAERLRSSGVEVWFDQSELRGGDVWDQKIRRQIKECALFVPIISASAQLRGEGYFRLEWRLADQRTLLMGRQRPFLVPICIDATSESEADVPDSFLAAQWIRLPGGAAADEFVQRVRTLLEQPEGRGASGAIGRFHSPGGTGATPVSAAPPSAPAVCAAEDSGPIPAEPRSAAVSPVPAAPPSGAKARLAAAGQTVLSPAPAAAPRRSGLRHLMLLGATAAVAVAGWGTWRFLQRVQQRNWAQTEAVPEIRRLIEREAFAEAHVLATRVEATVPGTADLPELWRKMTQTISITSEPSGAEVKVREYSDAKGEWRILGRTPLSGVRLPRGLKRWQVTANGHRTLERAGPPQGKMRFPLSRDSDVPAGMVAIAGGPANAHIAGMDPIERSQVDDYLIDRCEVTNRLFKEFVDAGGYKRREFWKHPINQDGVELDWEKAVALFQDATGRPGPATWELGRYPRGQDEFPVTGVSWHEAAAYAEFAGRSLPTVYHWVRAASTGMPTAILALSNFAGKGPAAVGTYQGMSAFGVFDMAGNVREWLWNPAGNHRHLLGGAWNDPTYMFSYANARPPLDRSPENGFRCVIYKEGRVPADTGSEIALSHRDYSKERPVGDDVFKVYLNQFSYDASALEVRVEATNETADWRRERVTIAAAYGNERLLVNVFLPKVGQPPFQTVMFFQGSGAISLQESETWAPPDYLLRSGRALVLPIYKGTFERRDGMTTTWPNLTHRHAEFLIKQVKDFRRAVDYVATRSDLDAERIAYYGMSWGGRMGGIIPAVDKRVKVCVLLLAGLPAGRALPEVDQFNYVSRVTVPVLMLNGRHDAIEPLEGSQLPMFRLLSTAPEHKRHVIFETGHGPFPQNMLIREVLDWLDKYLGPTK